MNTDFQTTENIKTFWMKDSVNQVKIRRWFKNIYKLFVFFSIIVDWFSKIEIFLMNSKKLAWYFSGSFSREWNMNWKEDDFCTNFLMLVIFCQFWQLICLKKRCLIRKNDRFIRFAYVSCFWYYLISTNCVK